MNPLKKSTSAYSKRTRKLKQRHANDNRPNIFPARDNSAVPQIKSAGMLEMTDMEVLTLLQRGYATRDPLFDELFANSLASEIDRLIDTGVIRPAPDRIVNGAPTEWLINMGPGTGRSWADTLFKASPLLKMLYTSIVQLGESYNRTRARLIEAGAVRAQDIQELACDGVEININRVVGTPGAVWSGLHLHTDDTRFTAALKAMDPASIGHRTVLARAFTISGYARRRRSDGSPQNDLGGALPFIIRPQALNRGGDKTIIDIVPAFHNTGAFFFPKTVHGVSRMIEGGVRYSFQAFFPSLDGWRSINALDHAIPDRVAA
jgi:hypothetical protein